MYEILYYALVSHHPGESSTLGYYIKHLTCRNNNKVQGRKNFIRKTISWRLMYGLNAIAH